MNKCLVFLLLGFFSLTVSAQEANEIDTSLPEFNFNTLDLKGEMYFLASDYLAGRRTGSIGNEVAAEYIAAQLEAYGYEPINDGSYFQEVPLRSVLSPGSATLTVGKSNFQVGENLLIMRGPAAVGDGNVVFANYGWVDEATGHDDYKDLDVEGKIVITRPGVPGMTGQQGVFEGLGKKPELAAERGAIAIYEIYSLPFPWSSFVGYFGGERIGINSGESRTATIPYGFIKTEDGFLEALNARKKTKGSFASAGMIAQDMNSRNVGGILRGSDPELADEYVILTAHFDHVGVGAQGGGAFTEQDSIFNGSRDNAFGTISLLSAARAFAEVPPRRSIIILAVTGEEMGLLGSQYYAANPLVPLEQTVYNFNTDGAGYTETDAISLFGANRTGIDPQVEQGAGAFDLRVIGNPAPEQNLYDRSDNVSFAARGVPALTFSPGFSEFNDGMMRYYHQVSDNPNTIDYDYLRKYCQAFTLSARLIANRDTRPFWAEGDKYEEAGRDLYNQK